MKGVDYTKALNKEREYFADTITKNNKAADRRIADANERAELVMDKQRKNFIEDKADLEKHYEKNITELNSKTREALEANNGKLEKEMDKEREAFTREAIVKRKDFDQRLNDITNSYKKSFDAERSGHTEQEDANKTRYAKNIQDQTDSTTKKLQDYQDEMTKSGADLKEQYKHERQQLVRAHEDKLNALQKDSSKQRSIQKERIDTDLRKSKEIHQAEMDQQKDYSSDRFKTLQTGFEDRYHKMARDYSEKNDQLIETQKEDNMRTNREHQQHLTDLRRDTNKQFRMIELEKRRRDNGSGEFAEVMNRQQGNKDEHMHEVRYDHLKAQLSDTQKNFQIKADEDREAYNDSLKAQKAEMTAHSDKKLNQSNADKIVTVAKEREKAEKQVSNRQHQNTLDKQAFEHQISLERSNAKTRVTKLKENFNASMKDLREKHEKAMEDVTKTSNQDKSQFIKNVQAKRNEEVFAMKREFDRMMDSTVQDYEQRLANYERDNQFLKMSMDQKIQNLTDQNNKALESQKKLFDDRRSADLKNNQILLDQKDHSMRTQMTQQSVGFQKKIDKLQLESDTKLKLLTNDYENKLKALKSSTEKEVAMKDTNHQMELDRVKMAYEEEKNRIVSSYENQISAIKAGHRDQMDQMKNFKNLS